MGSQKMLIEKKLSMTYLNRLGELLTFAWILRLWML